MQVSFCLKNVEQKTSKTNGLYIKIVLHNSSTEFEISDAVILVCHSIFICLSLKPWDSTNTCVPHFP